ncbi:MAG: VOC family protein [Ilumatobacteraceae bacterium]
MEYTALSPEEFDARHEGEWRFVLGGVESTFRAGSFERAAEFAAAIAAAAELAAHHPDIDIRYPDRVRVRLTTHAAGGVTTADLELAERISIMATAHGVTTDPAGEGRSQMVELCIDTMDATAIRPFWAAVTDYVVADDGSIVDPRRQGWAIWFQQMDEPRRDRNRFHIDVSVPHDVAEQRIAAAIAAGGRLVSDDRARAFWVLADADGNEACVCTWQDR